MESSQALEKLKHLCSKQEKCQADVLVLLKRWGIEQQHHQEIVSRLMEEGFINEERFALAFVKDKIRFDHWGVIKIRFFLHQKGIGKAACEDAIREIDKDEYRRMVGKELDKKRRSLKGTPREIWAKLVRYGSSRGYEMEIMHDFLDQIAPEE